MSENVIYTCVVVDGASMENLYFEVDKDIDRLVSKRDDYINQLAIMSKETSEEEYEEYGFYLYTCIYSIDLDTMEKSLVDETIIDDDLDEEEMGEWYGEEADLSFLDD